MTFATHLNILDFSFLPDWVEDFKAYEDASARAKRKLSRVDKRGKKVAESVRAQTESYLRGLDLKRVSRELQLSIAHWEVWIKAFRTVILARRREDPAAFWWINLDDDNEFCKKPFIETLLRQNKRGRYHKVSGGLVTEAARGANVSRYITKEMVLTQTKLGINNRIVNPFDFLLVENADDDVQERYEHHVMIAREHKAFQLLVALKKRRKMLVNA